MADFNALTALINAYIKQNGVKAITGQILNGVLRGMVSALGKGYTVAGEASPTTDPGTMTGPVAYIAHTAGTYEHFGNLVVAQGEVAMLIYDEAVWRKDVLLSLSANATVDANVGTPEVTCTFVDGVLTFDFRNMKGNPGDAAGFGAVTATVDANVGTPGVSVQTSGPDTAKNITFAFRNLKGETGVTSCVVTVDNTTGTPSCAVSLVGQELHLDFSGLKGAQGNTGSSVDYPFEIVNNLTTNDATKALSAAMGVQLESEVSQLEAKGGEITDLVLKDYALLATGKFSSGSTYKHAALPVNPGEVYFLVGDADSCRAAYATSDEAVASGDIPLVTGTSVIGMDNIGELYRFVIPAGCTHLLFNAGSPYNTKCYKSIGDAIDTINGNVATLKNEVEGGSGPLSYTTLYTGSKYYEEGEVGHNISEYYHSSGGNSGIYYGTVDVTGKNGVISATYLAGVGSSVTSIVWAVTDSNGVILAVYNRKTSGSSISATIDLTGLVSPTTLYFAFYKNSTPTFTLAASGLIDAVQELDEEVEALGVIVEELKSIADYPEQNGWLDGSNTIISYGSSKFKAIPISGGNTITVSKNMRNTDNVLFFVLKSFTNNPTLPYTPTFATGESGRRSIARPVPYSFQVASDAHYLLVAVKNTSGQDVSPYQLLIDGKDIISGPVGQVCNIYEKVCADYSLPVKVEDTYIGLVWGQGAALVGNNIAAFKAAEDDHSDNGTYSVRVADNIGTIVASGSHNISHANSVDYCDATDTLVLSGRLAVSTTTHDTNIYLVTEAKEKLEGGDMLDYQDAITIPVAGLNGLYTGCNCFGERKDILYLVTLEDPTNYNITYGKWVYKIQLGMGANDMTVLFPGSSYGTFISGCADNEYNGTARLVKEYYFELPCEIQGGKFKTGRLLLPIDIRIASKEKAFIVSLKLYESKAIIDEVFSIPTDENDGTTVRTESEDFVVIDGDLVLHQVILHKDTNVGTVFYYHI